MIKFTLDILKYAYIAKEVHIFRCTILDPRDSQDSGALICAAAEGQLTSVPVITAWRGRGDIHVNHVEAENSLRTALQTPALHQPKLSANCLHIYKDEDSESG